VRINIKLILLIGLFVISLLTGALFTVSNLVNRNVRTDILSNFNQQQRALSQMQSLIYDRLVESCFLIGQNSAFKANVSLKDTSTVREAVYEFADMVKVDIMIVTDNEGKVLHALGPVSDTGDSIRSLPGISEALSGAFPQNELEDMLLWTQNDFLFQVVSSPITTNNEILGTLTLGMALTDYEAKQLKAEVRSDVHFIMNDKVVASSLSGIERQKLPLFLEQIKDKSHSQNELVELDEDAYFISFSPLGQSNTCWLMCSVHRSKAMDLLNQIKEKMWWIGAVAFLIAIMLSWLIGNNISKPILEMVDVFGEVQRGNLDTSIQLKGGKEFKKLSLAFNEMVGGLRERLRLQKYVGDHTREQVKTDGKASSKYIDACIMFSDIRGFTKLSSTISPEAVIEILNKWLGFQAEIIQSYDGIIDKFVGDEIMTIFQGENAITRAIECANEIQDRSSEFIKQYSENISLGIGINYGSMVMGNIGISNRMNYTVIGSVVNLAARLCSAAKGGEILIPLITYKETQKEIVIKPLRNLELKGVKGITKVVNVRNEKEV